MSNNNSINENNSLSSNNTTNDKSSENTNRHNSQLASIITWSTAKNIIDALTFIVLAVTLFMTRQTINEMQKDRNESYKAVIAANPITENITTSSEIFMQHFIEDDDGKNKVLRNYVTGYAVAKNTDTYHVIPFSHFDRQEMLTPMIFANIGPGIATKVRFSWEKGNAKTLYQSLLEVDEEAPLFTELTNDRFYYFPEGNTDDNPVSKEHFVWSDDKVLSLNCSIKNTEYTYMLSNCQETYEIQFPILYSLLISEIFIHDPKAQPCVKLNVEFSDTQGIEYLEDITLTANNLSPNYFTTSIEKETHSSASGITFNISANYSTPVQK